MISTILKFFETQLAGIFDKLRLGSPIAYFVVLVIIFGGSAVIENYSNLTEDLPWLFNGITDELLKALAAILLSSRTKRHLDHTDDHGEGTSVMSIDEDD